MQSIFREPREGFVAHTAASKLLAEDQEIRESIRKSTDELLQAATQEIGAAKEKGGVELWEDEEQVRILAVVVALFCFRGLVGWDDCVDVVVGLSVYE